MEYWWQSHFADSKAFLPKVIYIYVYIKSPDPKNPRRPHTTRPKTPSTENPNPKNPVQAFNPKTPNHHKWEKMRKKCRELPSKKYIARWYGFYINYHVGFLALSRGQILKLQNFMTLLWLQLSPHQYWLDKSSVWMLSQQMINLEPFGQSGEATRSFPGYLSGSGREISEIYIEIRFTVQDYNSNVSMLCVYIL